jgi:hypothetical protein
LPPHGHVVLVISIGGVGAVLPEAELKVAIDELLNSRCPIVRSDVETLEPSLALPASERLVLAHVG